MALCWIVRVGNAYYGTNTGSDSVSGFRVNAAGQPSLFGATLATTGDGPIDLAASPDGRFLYVESGAAGAVAAYRINADDTLTALGSVPAPAGLEGIVAVGRTTGPDGDHRPPTRSERAGGVGALPGPAQATQTGQREGGSR
jgi:hypothetical protein